MKFAGSFYGADLAAAGALGTEAPRALEPGNLQVITHHTHKIVAPAVMFLGVVPLAAFRYAEIRQFGRDSIEAVTRELPAARVVAMTFHGVNHGLDEKEAALALIAGIIDARRSQRDPNCRLESVLLVEKDARRVGRVDAYLNEFLNSESPKATNQASDPSDRNSDQASVKRDRTRNHLDIGRGSEKKPHIFVAMPFAEDYHDEWEIAIREPAVELNFLCERMDAEVSQATYWEELKTGSTRVLCW